MPLERSPETPAAPSEALPDADAGFRNAFEEAPIGSALVSPDGGRFLRVNRALCALIGYECDELLELTFPDITHPDDQEPGNSLVRRVLSGELRTFHIDKRYVRRDGAIIWGTINVSLVRDDAGEPLYLVAQIEDATERHHQQDELRTAEAHFRTAFDSAPTGLILTTLDGIPVRVNPALCEILGYAREHLGERGLERLSPSLRTATPRRSRACRAGSSPCCAAKSAISTPPDTPSRSSSARRSSATARALRSTS